MGTLMAPTPLWALLLRRPGVSGCRHVRWPRDAKPALWSTALRRAVDDDDVRRLTFAASMAAAHRGLDLDRRSVHVCRITNDRRVWVAVARPRRARKQRWQRMTKVARWLGIR